MKLTVVMYHYVRPVRHSRFPELKALELDDFREQLAYLARHHTVISGADLLAAAAAGAWNDLPPAPVLLTFDDGYADHFAHVLPALQERGMSGSFFVPGQCVLERRMLDVNKIHFVLALVPEKRALVDRVLTMIAEWGPQFGSRSGAEYWQTLAVPSRFDTADVVFLKRVLQRELPAPMRTRMVNELFREIVTADEAAFAAELYLSEHQIASMRDAGMYFGSHGYEHSWLSYLNPAEQQLEIARTRAFLQRIGTPLDAWMMCYPYGAYDRSLLTLLRAAQCRIGFTTRVGIATLGKDDLLTLPRLDTNDVPRRAEAARARANAVASRLPHAADM